MTEKKIEQKKGDIGTFVNYIMGSILLIIGIIVLVLGIPHLFFGTIEGDMLQIMEYNTFSSLMVFLGIYISLFGLHFLLQKLNKSIKAYLLIVAGVSIIVFSFIAPKILYSYAYLGLLAYIFLGFGSIVYGAYSLSKRYMPRKNLVYGNIGPIAIILILVIVFA